MKCCLKLHYPLTANSNKFGDHLTFDLASLLGQNFDLVNTLFMNTLVYDEI